MENKAKNEVLRLLLVEKLSVSEIAQRRKTTRQNIYKILKRAAQAGSQDNQNLSLNGLRAFHVNDNRAKIRLHAQEFNAKIYNPTDRFNTLIGRTFKLDNSTIRVFARSVEVYSGRSFYGPDAFSANAAAWEYWHIFFKKLEKKLGVCIYKPAGHNIKMVKVGHFAEMENELAGAALRDRQKVSLKGPDAKEWFLIDNSFNLKEAETTHSTAAREDMQEIIGPFFSALRQEPRVLDKLSAKISQLDDVLAGTIKDITQFIKLARSQPEAAQAQPEGEFRTDKPDYIG
jgi:predicted DNA-binding protein YlxM (UPF0122 family)